MSTKCKNVSLTYNINTQQKEQNSVMWIKIKIVTTKWYYSWDAVHKNISYTNLVVYNCSKKETIHS